jgi:hypothetical protein
MQTHGVINTLENTHKTYVSSLNDFNDALIDMPMIEDDA